MDAPTFNGLTFGNTIANEAGEKFIVTHTIKDPAGKTTAVGIVEAFDLTDAGGLTLVNTSSSVTFLRVQPGGKTVLMGETIQGE